MKELVQYLAKSLVNDPTAVEVKETEREDTAVFELKVAKDDQVARYRDAAKAGDTSVAATIVGEAVGLIHAIEPAAVILERMVAEAEQLLGSAARYVAR